MKTQRRRCPVCHRLVGKTMHGGIEGHWDSIGQAVCMGTGEPYYITISKGKKNAA